LIVFGVIDLFIGFGLFFLFTNDGNTIMNIPHPQMIGVQVILISIVSIGFCTVILSLLTKKLKIEMKLEKKKIMNWQIF